MDLCLVFLIILIRSSLCNGFFSEGTRRALVVQPLEISKRLPSILKASLPDRSEPSASTENLEDERRRGIFVLLTVPFAWGSFEPCARYVYSVDPPVPAFVYSLAYYSVATLALVIATLISDARRRPSDADSKLPTPNSPQADGWPVMGGVELGLYLFVGNALQVLGLKTVPPDRAAFLLQMTTLIVPLLEALLARDWSAVSSRTWLACAIALAGVVVMGFDGGGGPPPLPAVDAATDMSAAAVVATSNVFFSSGDLLVLGAAVAYSFHCIRLEGYAQNSPSPPKLAVSKAATETLCSALAVTAFVGYASSTPAGEHEVTASGSTSSSNALASFALESGREISHFASGVSDGIASGTLAGGGELGNAALAILCTGTIGVAYTIYAQTYGQSRVRPATANLIYTIQPICTALFAWFLLGETLGPAGFLGGALIGLAVLLVAAPARSKELGLESE